MDGGVERSHHLFCHHSQAVSRSYPETILWIFEIGCCRNRTRGPIRWQQRSPRNNKAAEHRHHDDNDSLLCVDTRKYNAGYLYIRIGHVLFNRMRPGGYVWQNGTRGVGSTCSDVVSERAVVKIQRGIQPAQGRLSCWYVCWRGVNDDRIVGWVSRECNEKGCDVTQGCVVKDLFSWPNRKIERLTDWLTDWLINRLTNRKIERLADLRVSGRCWLTTPCQPPRG